MEDKINILPMAGNTIAKMMDKEGVASNDMEYFDVVLQFAIDKLKDHDGVFNIRRYFKEILWPEKKE